MNVQERTKLEAYLKGRFQTPNLQVRQRPRKTDSAEVYIGEEFIGVISRDEDEGELSWHFTMSILEEDLAEDS